jgi:hypothetical protein
MGEREGSMKLFVLAKFRPLGLWLLCRPFAFPEHR